MFGQCFTAHPNAQCEAKVRPVCEDRNKQCDAMAKGTVPVQSLPRLDLDAIMRGVPQAVGSGAPAAPAAGASTRSLGNNNNAAAAAQSVKAAAVPPATTTSSNAVKKSKAPASVGGVKPVATVTTATTATMPAATKTKPSSTGSVNKPATTAVVAAKKNNNSTMSSTKSATTAATVKPSPAANNNASQVRKLNNGGVPYLPAVGWDGEALPSGAAGADASSSVPDAPLPKKSTPAPAPPTASPASTTAANKLPAAEANSRPTSRLLPDAATDNSAAVPDAAVPNPAAAPSAASNDAEVVAGGMTGKAKTTRYVTHSHSHLLTHSPTHHTNTSRYYDCCKASCGWEGKGPLVNPVRSVDKSSLNVSPVPAKSGCEPGGVSYYDPRQVGFAVTDRLAYGFVAARVQSLMDEPVCCKCFQLTFTSTAIAGKKMIVQVTNSGGLGEDHFDIAMPGGGMGDFVDGCKSQFQSFDGGARWGGVDSADACDKLPPLLQKGCRFRFDWMQGVSNPDADYVEVKCPRRLTEMSGCERRS